MRQDLRLGARPHLLLILEDSHQGPPFRLAVSCDQERQHSSLERLQHFFDDRAVRIRLGAQRGTGSNPVVPTNNLISRRCGRLRIISKAAVVVFAAVKSLKVRLESLGRITPDKWLTSTSSRRLEHWRLLRQRNGATCILPLTVGLRVFDCENLALHGEYTPGTIFPT